MTAYAIAHLRDAEPHPDIAEYMERIAGTFEPFGAASSCTARHRR